MRLTALIARVGVIILLSCVAGAVAAPASAEPAPATPVHRFFSDDSFWNQSIPADAEVDARTERWIKLLETEPTKTNFTINSEQWTIPLYEVDRTTPLVKVARW